MTGAVPCHEPEANEARSQPTPHRSNQSDNAAPCGYAALGWSASTWRLQIGLNNLPGTTSTPATQPLSKRPLSASGWGTFAIRIQVRFKSGEIRSLTHMLEFSTGSVTPARGIQPQNVAQKIGTRRWRWTIFLAAPKDTLDRIRCVEYTLHPTFPDPVRDVCARGSSSRAFALTATGWGTFRIGIRVLFKDNSVQKLGHQLTF